MLTRVRVEHFQSLRSLDLQFSKFVVVVGPSNSGKSALLRAIRVLAQNASSPSFVSHGQRSAEVALTFDEEVSVGLKRGKGLSTYWIGDPDGVEEYPKAGTSVPAEVARSLRFASIEDESLSFAFQFDRPFLLSDPGTKVAKVLGDLTNINVLFAATREANRRRLEAQSRLKVRRGDLQRVTERLRGFADLPDRIRRQEQDQATFEAVTVAAQKSAHLRQLVDEVEVCEAALKALPPLPAVSVDVAGVERSAGRVEALRSLVVAVVEASRCFEEARVDVRGLTQNLDDLRREYAAVLEAAGTCPVCGQQILGEHAEVV